MVCGSVFLSKLHDQTGNKSTKQSIQHSAVLLSHYMLFKGFQFVLVQI